MRRKNLRNAQMQKQAPSASRQKIRRKPFDWGIFLVVVGLLIFGVLMVFSASAPYAAKTRGDSQFFLKRDVVYALLGLVVMVGLSFLDFRVYKRHAWGIYFFAFLLCILVFLPKIGVSVNNARRWIGYGSYTLMPSDVMKVASVILLSYLLTRQPANRNGSFGTFCWVMILILLTILPIYKQPNFSAVVVTGMTLIVLFFINGMNLRLTVLLVILLGIGGLIAFWPYPGNYRLERVLIILDPLKDVMNSTWQLVQSLFAVSSGGLFGVGYGQSRQKFDYLADEPHNDFIFSVISEELGFFGCLLLFAAFVYLVYRCLKVAERCEDPFARSLVLGLCFVIAFQAAVNIGVAIGLVPTTGITLPFISYGGSSLLIMCGIIGIILNISRHKEGDFSRRTHRDRREERS